MDLLERFVEGLDRHALRPWLAGRPVVVGVSGGPDSLCLLHLLHRLSSPLAMALHVATLDHGLRGPASAADAAFVERTARRWGLPVHRATRDVQAVARSLGLGLEEAARLARYTFLAQAAYQVGAQAIAVGHNADDQAETILMHLIRGSGLAGLRGMLPLAPLSDYHLLPDAPPAGALVLLRPLLDIPRADIEAYCAAHDLHPRQDATNVELTYFRNRLRHQVLPLLATLNPNIRQLLVRTGHVLAADYALLQELVQAEFTAALRRQLEDVIVLDLERFRRPALPQAIRRGLVREALRRLAPELRDVGFLAVEQALEAALAGTTGSQVTLPGGVMLRVDYRSLTFHRPGAPLHCTDRPWLPPGTALRVRVPGPTVLPTSGWVLHTRWLQPGEDPASFWGRPFTATLALPEPAELTLRTRRPGDRFAPQGLGGHTQKLSDTLINARIPAPQRDVLPLLVVDGQLAWVVLGPQGRIAEPFAVRPNAGRILLAFWQGPATP